MYDVLVTHIICSNLHSGIAVLNEQMRVELRSME